MSAVVGTLGPRWDGLGVMLAPQATYEYTSILKPECGLLKGVDYPRPDLYSYPYFLDEGILAILAARTYGRGACSSFTQVYDYSTVLCSGLSSALMIELLFAQGALYARKCVCPEDLYKLLHLTTHA